MRSLSIYPIWRDKLGGFMQKILIVLGVFLMLSISVNAQSPQEAKPSFDCAKATTKVEKMICEDSSGELQNLDSKDSSPLAQNDDINSSTNNINFSLQPQNDNLIQGQHSGLNHIETLDKTSHLNSLNVTSKTSLQNQDSLNSQNTKWYENFAKTHNIKLHYRDFSYNISSSDIMANLEMLKDFIPPQIREEALRILKKN